MKKLGLGIVAIGAVGALGWAAFWYAGKGKIDDRIQQEIADYDADGWTVSIGSYDVGGFPMGYDVRLVDIGMVHRETGGLVQFPEVQARWSLTDAQTVRVAIPKPWQALLPLTEQMRLANPVFPERFKLSFDSEDLLISTVRGADDSVVREGTATRLLAWIDQDDFAGKMDLSLDDVTWRSQPDASGDLLDMTMGKIMGLASLPTEDGGIVRLGLDIAQLDLDHLSTVEGAEALQAVLHGTGEGRLKSDYTMSSFEFEVDIEGGQSAVTGRLSASSGNTNGTAAIENGNVSLIAESDDVVWAYFPEDEANPMRGKVTIGKAAVDEVLSLAASDAPVPGKISVKLDKISLDDGLWQLVDPKGALDRSPGALSMEADLMMAVEHRLIPGSTTPQVSYNPTNVSLGGFSVSALGATAQAAGDVDILQPLNLMLGEFQVKATGLLGLFGDLEKAGLLTAEQRETGDAILQVYARPGDGPDSWETEIGFGAEGTTVNGLPVQ